MKSAHIQFSQNNLLIIVFLIYLWLYILHEYIFYVYIYCDNYTALLEIVLPSTLSKFYYLSQL